MNIKNDTMKPIRPRCGAKNRAGNPCGMPKMPNGRCRFHSGMSTGPRTAEGIERIRASRTKHGGYSAAMKEFRREMRALRKGCLKMEKT